MERPLLLGVALASALLCTAQVRQGPRLGLSIASQTSGQFLQWTGLPKLGPIIGWSFDVPVKKQISVLLEPMLMSKGSWTRDATLKTNTYITLRYLELPMLAKVDMQPDTNGLFLTTGFIYGYWIYGRQRTVVDGQETYDQTYELAGSEARRAQWSFALGIGKQGERWGWELRGQSSITPFSSLQRGQNLVFGIHVTYRLPLVKKEEDKEKDEERLDP